jgi:hypothetical protein
MEYSFAFLDSILYAAACSSPTTSPLKNVAGDPKRFDNHGQFSAVVERPLFRGLTNLPANWEDFLVEIDDEDDDEEDASYT